MAKDVGEKNGTGAASTGGPTIDREPRRAAVSREDDHDKTTAAHTGGPASSSPSAARAPRAESATVKPKSSESELLHGSRVTSKPGIVRSGSPAAPASRTPERSSTAGIASTKAGSEHISTELVPRNGELSTIAAGQSHSEMHPSAAGEGAPDGVAPVRTRRPGLYLLLLVVFIALSSLVALGVSRSQSPVYGAETDILFELDANLEAGFLREDRRLTTQVVTIQSRAVLDPAAQKLQMDVDDLADDLSVEVVEGSEIIRLQTRGDSRPEALERLDVVVDVYLGRLAAADAGADSLALIDEELGEIAVRDEELQVQIDRQVRQTRAGESDALVSVLLSDLEALRLRRSGLESQRSERVLRDLIKPRFTVLTPSFVLPDPLAPKPLQASVLGALVGALVGTGVVFVMERRKPRLR